MRQFISHVYYSKSIAMKFWSHGTSSAVIDTQLKFKERDKIISENSSLTPYSEKKKTPLSINKLQQKSL